MTTYDTDVRKAPTRTLLERDAPVVVETPSVPEYHLPSPPSDEEKYSYFAVQRRWPFVWLFVSQTCLVYAFAAVMLRTPDTALGLILLTFMLPPMVVNLWLRMRRRRVTLEQHVVGVETWRATLEAAPSVDVFLPTCGEHPVVLANTFRHVGALEWDGRSACTCSTTQTMRRPVGLALEFGFTTRAREPRRVEEGGQPHRRLRPHQRRVHRRVRRRLRTADRTSSGRPCRTWATRRTGVVQTAQYFDVDRRVNYFARYAGALQELFFRWIQPARDTCEAAICAGTNVRLPA